MSFSPNDPSTTNLPRTPDRNCPVARIRYPSHLSREVDAEGKPRPLLHRRGTSQTYETLEDLLKEAGYKETRIFTPETERRDAEQADGAEQKGKDNARGVGGAVVKLFSSWMTAKKTEVNQEARQVTSLARPCPSSPLAHRGKKPSSNASSLRIASPPDSSGSSIRTVRPSSSNYCRHPNLSQLQHQHSLTREGSSRPTLTTSSTSSSTLQPHSRARIALRHAASAPQIDKRRSRHQPRASRKPPPPLPPTWLESLSSALRSPRPLTQPATPTSAGPRKPAIVSQRASASPVGVTITNVVCHSTPSSRSSSTTRKPAVPLPCLAQTSVYEEQIPAPPHSPHHLPPETKAPVNDDDEDEEVNLTVMLIPSKRQHSIRSLRSVLQHHNSLPAAAHEYARVMRRRIAANENREEDHWESSEFLTARPKRRRSGLPRNWGWAP